jgi:signal transduction histidine kinase
MPLYLRILLLFLLNVAVLFGALVWAAHRQMQAGLQSFLGTMVGANLQRAAEEMNTRLTSTPRGTDADHGIQVNVPNDLIVTAEPALLARAIGNVLRNSLRYAGGSGPIEITAAATAGNKVQITIADRGPGVPPETLPRLFEPFFRTDEARTPDKGGAGLGLAIVKHCIEACGGTAAAANREPHGFCVSLILDIWNAG